MDWLGIVILLVFDIILWLTAYAWHKRCLPSFPDVIRLPRMVGLLFGSTRQDGLLSGRGIVIQLAVYIMSPLLVLVRNGQISQEAGIECFGWSGTALGLLVVIIAFRNLKKKE